MVPGLGGRRENIEDRSQYREREAWTIGWGRLYRGGEILADFGEKFVEVWGLADQVDE